MKRNEFCVIWRDTNFSSKPVYFNEYDKKFKTFLKNRKNYIEKKAIYNIYLCETTSKALKLIKRKKYNKIILISNIGNNLNGKKIIDEARKIIKNDTIVLLMDKNMDPQIWTSGRDAT
jgi:DNA-binding response OmpR family regulator